MMRAVGNPKDTLALDFAAGMMVAMVNPSTDEVAELVRVSSVQEGVVAVQGYTARFRASDGSGIPLDEKETVLVGAVFDISGRLLEMAEEREICVRSIPARYNIRPATATDRAALRDREESLWLASQLARHLREASRGRARIDLQALRTAARALGVSQSEGPAAPVLSMGGGRGTSKR